MRIIPFRAGHLDLLALQPHQAYLAPLVAGADGTALEQAGPAFTAVIDGRVAGIAGVMEPWPGRATGWALLAAPGPGAFVALHRAVARFLDAQDYTRVEATVDADFGAGQRWAELLGFEKEALMRSYGPGGRDAYLYARVKRP